MVVFKAPRGKQRAFWLLVVGGGCPGLLAWRSKESFNVLGGFSHVVELGWRRMAVGTRELGWTMKKASGVLGVEEIFSF